MLKPSPFFKLPDDTDQLLYLIGEELKSQKFFDGLFAVGVEDCFYQPRLGKVILHAAGLDDGRDETLEWYQALIDRSVLEVKQDYSVLAQVALRVYHGLETERLRRLQINSIRD